jgi:hypothetical protein
MPARIERVQVSSRRAVTENVTDSFSFNRLTNSRRRVSREEIEQAFFPKSNRRRIQADEPRRSPEEVGAGLAAQMIREARRRLRNA